MTVNLDELGIGAPALPSRRDGALLRGSAESPTVNEVYGNSLIFNFSTPEARDFLLTLGHLHCPRQIL